jgi:putative transposase
MARKIRIQYSGAMYHIMSRGDHYEPIYHNDQDREVFLKTTGEVCEKTGWIIHSYVLMTNHYHWLLETPEPNLVDGMKWFQSTYTRRFNTRNKLAGHLFQGRYRSLLIDHDDGDHIQFVSNYIHLNPARAGLLDSRNPNLNQYMWSSYPSYLLPPSKRSSWLSVDRIFRNLRIPRDNTAGRKKYTHYMERALIEALNPKLLPEFEKKWNTIRKSWYLGDDTFKEKLLQFAGKVLEGKKPSSFDGLLKQDHTEEVAKEYIKKALNVLNLDASELEKRRKSDSHKQVIAWFLKTSTTVKNQWIADNLHMGHWTSVPNAVKRIIETRNRTIIKLRNKLKNIL